MFGLTPEGRRSRAQRKGDVRDYGRSIFEDFFNDSFISSVLSPGNAVRADIRENEEEYIVEAEVPGLKKEDIKLDLRHDVLTISVDREEEIKEERDNYVRRERRFGSIKRSFLVENVRHEGVKAQYEDGLLTVILPKDKNVKSDRYRIDVQ